MSKGSNTTRSGGEQSMRDYGFDFWNKGKKI